MESLRFFLYRNTLPAGFDLSNPPIGIRVVVTFGHQVELEICSSLVRYEQQDNSIKAIFQIGNKTFKKSICSFGNNVSLGYESCNRIKDKLVEFLNEQAYL